MCLYGFNLAYVCGCIYVNEYKQISPLIIEGFVELVIGWQNRYMKF